MRFHVLQPISTALHQSTKTRAYIQSHYMNLLVRTMIRNCYEHPLTS